MFIFTWSANVAELDAEFFLAIVVVVVVTRMRLWRDIVAEKAEARTGAAPQSVTISAGNCAF